MSRALRAAGRLAFQRCAGARIALEMCVRWPATSVPRATQRRFARARSAAADRARCVEAVPARRACRPAAPTCAQGSGRSSLATGRPSGRTGTPGTDRDASTRVASAPASPSPARAPVQCARAGIPPRLRPADRSGSAAGKARTSRTGRSARAGGCRLRAMPRETLRLHSRRALQGPAPFRRPRETARARQTRTAP